MHERIDGAERAPPARRTPGRGGVEPVTSPSAPTALSPWQFEMYVGAEADGDATPEQLAVLEADRPAWRATLLRLLREAEEHLASARSLPGDERDQVVADLSADRRQLSAAWARLTAQRGPEAGDGHGPAREDDLLEPGVVQLQVSWEPGRVVAWAAGPRAQPADGDEVLAMLGAAGAPESGWTRRGAVPLPGGGNADAFAAPVGEVLGWLVAAGADQAGPDVGPSVRWLGQVGIWAVELTARGAMVPLLRQRRRGNGNSRESTGSYSVRWTPALVDPTRLGRVAADMPGAVLALDPNVDGRALTRSALTGMVDAICRDSARRLEVPAPPPRVRTSSDVTEAFLARLDGSAFDAPPPTGRRDRRPWGTVGPVRHPGAPAADRPPRRPRPLRRAGTSRCSPSGPDGGLVPIERAIVNAGADQSDYDDELSRLERMLPALLRPGADRRGEVILSQEEAWELMVDTGPRLAAAGFDVRAPALSRRKPTPTLRVLAETVHRDRRWERTSSPTSSGRRCSTTSSSARPTSRAWPKKPAR